jgi:hypothetical protein
MKEALIDMAIYAEKNELTNVHEKLCTAIEAIIPDSQFNNNSALFTPRRSEVQVIDLKNQRQVGIKSAKYNRRIEGYLETKIT